MNTNIAKKYTARIAQASPTELVVVSYELIISYMEKAKADYENKEKQEFVKSLKGAQAILTHMIDSLNFDFEISYNLFSLYLYINRNITSAICKLDIMALKNSISVLNRLKTGYEGIVDTDKTGSVMSNSEQIYAGLTYGKDKLNEHKLSSSDNRGYKV